MNIAIIDDDKLAIESLKKELGKFADINIVGIAHNGKDGLEMIPKCKPELLFLDVEMPDMTGLEFLEDLREFSEDDIAVVIYTSHDRYMLEAFRKDAFDFLMKPIIAKDLKAIIDHYGKSRSKIGPSSQGSTIKSTSKKDSLILYTNTSDFRFVKIKDIGMFVYNRERRIWEVRLNDVDLIPLKRSVTRDSIVALDPRFIQVHQSYIINVEYLTEVIDNTCHFCPPFDDIEEVHVGRLFRHRLLEQFGSL